MYKDLIDITKVIYRGYTLTKGKICKKSIEVIGIDTEAYDDGRCFIISTSLGDSYNITDFPACFFRGKYRGKKFVAYNLKYDEGALLQFLPKENLKELQETLKTTHDKYKIKIIPGKCLTIRYSNYTCTFYDMYNFYHGSLEYNSQKYLHIGKQDIETKSFSRQYVLENNLKIRQYCIQDAILVKKLADVIIKRFESFGVYPQKLYSTAYVSYQYFRQKCNYVTVRRFWNEDKKLLSFAMQSYNGGKFEVTEKGCGLYYEYDINSAYPFEIARLTDISYARIVWSKSYHRYAEYGFINVRMKIPVSVFSPIAIKYGTVNVYPVGYIEKVITKNEYDFLISKNADITIVDAVWLMVDKKEYPYKKEIEKLTTLKNKFKAEAAELDYHTIKILLNSLYGKFCQLIKSGDKYTASTCWNPIYASIITANTRIKVSKMQNDYKDIIAVHTDSVISKSPLPIESSRSLGDFVPVVNGKGIILGSGIYQIGKIVKFRGFNLDTDLFKLVDTNKKTISITNIRPYTWKEVMFHNWDVDKINRFTEVDKTIKANFDRKRLWLKDWHCFKEILHRNVTSLPLYNTSFGV